MATYKYQQNLFDGASAGYVKYNISPDFGTPVAPGETITITGQAYSRDSAIKSIEVSTHATGIYKSTYVNKSIAKGSAATFKIEFPMWTLSTAWGTERMRNAPIDFTFWSSAGAGGNGSGTIGVAAQKISYLDYRISVWLRSVSFERYAQSGSKYTKNDEGNRVVGGFAIGLTDGRTASDITTAKVEISSSAGTQTLTIPAATLTAALTQNGYSESAPALFASISFDTSLNYTLQFTFGDTYNTFSFSVLISRAFANVHMSGCRTGGVAFGKFSSATEGNPLFECEYPAVFRGGIQVAEQSLAISSTFKAYGSAGSGYQGVRLRNNGFMAELFGTISPASAIAGSTTVYQICTIPVGLRPKYQIDQLCQGTGQNQWLLRITDAGVVTFSRYRAAASWGNADTTVWLPFHAMWLI